MHMVQIYFKISHRAQKWQKPQYKILQFSTVLCVTAFIAIQKHMPPYTLIDGRSELIQNIRLVA